MHAALARHIWAGTWCPISILAVAIGATHTPLQYSTTHAVVTHAAWCTIGSRMLDLSYSTSSTSMLTAVTLRQRCFLSRNLSQFSLS